ncbi:MAG: hypothetical protein K2X81_15640, partial [Candidatus Obscuribacterales bacterium]|nr:hypothetical protein [Candidatus Obscuribacterales bacterium]
AHGGEIACLSEAGKGSTFLFKLPMSATVPAGQKNATPDMNLESSASVSKNKKPGSIKVQFAAMMCFFICVQCFLFFELFETFKQSALSAKHFAEEKAIVMETQDLFALCLLSIQSAGEGEFKEADDWLKKMQDKIDWLVSRSKAPEQLQFIAGSSEQFQFPAGSLLLNAGHSKSTRFFRLLMQSDGNLVLDGPKRMRLWETGKPEANPNGNCCATFQKDGNLVLYHGHSPYWQSASNGYPNSVLVISTHKPFLFIVDAASNIVVWPKGLSVNQELAGIDKQMRTVHKIGNYLDRHPEKSLDTMMRIKGRAESCFNEIEESIYRIFDLQKASFESAYEGDKIFRSRLSIVLAVAAIADLVIILAASFIALRILERINLLKAKTEDFAQGTPINQSLSGNDELTLLDQQLCEASSAILEGETQKQELIAVINHDLRTPLTALLTGIELLADGACGEIAKEPAEILKHSTHELEYLLSQINDLLLIEKIDSGTYNMSTERLCFAEILEESLNKVIDSETKGVSVDIADEFDDSIIRGEKQLLTRLCAIVIANAISASAGSGKLTVSLREVENALKAEIADCGPGIDPELQPQIFNRFRFVRGKALTGLGLPLAERLCKLHAGSINLITRQDGTTVAITLPIAK